MPNKNVPASSFMNLFKEIVYDKSQNPNFSLDIWDSYVINPFNKGEMKFFLLHRVEAGQTWVKLSRTYYDDERLWWILPLFNDIEDPFIALDTELSERGIIELQVLKPQYVNQLLLISRQQKIINDRQTKNGS